MTATIRLFPVVDSTTTTTTAVVVVAVAATAALLLVLLLLVTAAASAVLAIALWEKKKVATKEAKSNNNNNNTNRSSTTVLSKTLSLLTLKLPLLSRLAAKVAVESILKLTPPLLVDDDDDGHSDNVFDVRNVHNDCNDDDDDSTDTNEKEEDSSSRSSSSSGDKSTSSADATTTVVASDERCCCTSTSPSLIPTEPAAAQTEQQQQRDDDDDGGGDQRDFPKHVAIIMDGNRRYGRKARRQGQDVTGNAREDATSTAAKFGHEAGAETLYDAIRWCSQIGTIRYLTVYAFSLENWDRRPSEVLALMKLFADSSEKYRDAMVRNNVRVRLVTTAAGKEILPPGVRAALEGLEAATNSRCRDGTGLQVNLCISYSGRGEIVDACRMLAERCCRSRDGDNSFDPADITERSFQEAMLVPAICPDYPDPDLLIRTSGEYRLSNFLLWELAYTELFFVDWHWPETRKDQFLGILRAYATNRKRRFGK